ncbi:MAG: hypothetical protein KAH57_01160 [Thermoplasmata archaeon]|nr:hypothetical protein [Thermoplasmata archaeon]
MVKWKGRYFRCVLLVMFLFSIIYSLMIFSLQEVEAINETPIGLQIDDSKYFAQLNGEDDAIIHITGSVQYNMVGSTTHCHSVSVKIFADSPYFNTSEDEGFTFTNDTEMIMIDSLRNY